MSGSTSTRPSGVRGVRLAAFVLLVAALGIGGAATPVTPAVGQTPAKPNVLIFITDDQRAFGTMEYMPLTRRWFGEGGTTFTNGYATTPLCCPARAAIMSGRFNHNNGVRTNALAEQLEQEATMQAYLQGAGYRTAIVGKYLNGYPIERDPPYFHKWHVLSPQGDTYYGNKFNNNGTVENEANYSTDVIRDRAISLIQNDFGASDAQPWLMYVTPFAPHHPWEPAARHSLTDVGTWDGNPGVSEQDKSDKPDFVRRSNRTLEDARVVRQGQLRSLQSVDEMVDEIFDTMTAEEEQNTIAFFISDNGFMWSEHGLSAKNHPYTESIRVPFLARWPGQFPAGANDGRFTANIDIMPTVLQAAGVTPNVTFPLDGRSLLDPTARQKMFLEAWTTRGGWASVRTPSYQYIAYQNNDGSVRFREYYDVVKDPYQLQNLFADRSPRNDPFPGTLDREVQALRNCRGQGGPLGCVSLLDRPGVPQLCPGSRNRPGRHLVGGDGKDDILGGSGRDVACGGDRRDKIDAAGGKDVVVGGTGADRLKGGGGNDLILGKTGRDVCDGGPGKDKFRGCEKVVDGADRKGGKGKGDKN